MRYFSDFLIRSAGGTIPADIRTGRDVNFSLNKISAPLSSSSDLFLVSPSHRRAWLVTQRKGAWSRMQNDRGCGRMTPTNGVLSLTYFFVLGLLFPVT